MDVEYLRSNSRVQSSIIFVDTGARDKVAWPKPSEFDVTFDSPYRNVVSMSVLDATIPATMYVVDYHNNHLKMFARTGGSRVEVDYSLLEDLREQISSAEGFPPFMDILSDTEGDKATLALFGNTLPPAAESSQGETTGIFRWTEQIITDSTADDEPSITIEAGRLTTVAADDYIDTQGDVLIEIRRRDGGGSIKGKVSSNALVDSPAVYSVYSDDNDDLFLMGHGAARIDLEQSTGETYHVLSVYNVRIEPGNYDAPSLVKALNYAMPDDPLGETGEKLVMLGTPSALFPEDSPDFMQFNGESIFTSRRPFWFDMESSGMCDVLGFSELAEDAEEERYSRLRLGENRKVFGSVPPPEVLEEEEIKTWRIRPPGVINLNGIRFVILRCPQIEDASPSQSGHANSAGVGLFKIYDQTLAHLRFDFVTFSNSDFHPIGKLSRLHLRFERRGGELYDFKGVDFHIMLVLRFLEPSRPNFTSSEMLKPDLGRGVRHLNPDYDPDVLRYMSRVGQELDESDTDSDMSLLENSEHRGRFEIRRAGMAARASREAESYREGAVGGGARLEGGWPGESPRASRASTSASECSSGDTVEVP